MIAALRIYLIIMSGLMLVAGVASFASAKTKHERALSAVTIIAIVLPCLYYAIYT